MAPSVDKRIVVGVDGSESSLRALEWAAGQAELTGARMDVVTAWQWPTSFGWAVAYPDGWNPQADAQKVLDEAVDPVRREHPGVTIGSTVVEGHPAPALVEASEGAALLVVGSRGHGEFAGMLLGSVSEHCISHAHCPVLVLRGES
jgi:nucleotide-binding universal stress UspA family protein